MPESSRTERDWLMLLGFCAFLFFFGLNFFGLIGADEPRYAQIAREMLARHDWITPVLGGKPWLEKPVFYYWEAMISYRIFGVSDWAARIPSAFDSSLLVIAIYVFLRRLRPGVQLDGALICASTAGMVGFARAASMDMPLTAMFAIGMIAWYAWYETQRRLYLLVFYGFIALGVLAKGPVAAFFAAAIILIFVFATGDVATLRKTLWLPGILVFCAVGLPWYIAVQLRNPEFFHVFILEHNLARFGTNLYHHREPFWYYGPVALLALLPWTIFAAEAGLEFIRIWWSDRRRIADTPEALDLFLAIWLFFPIVFFSLSASKLPGYILPALPAAALLLAQYLRRHIAEQIKPPLLTIVLHSVLATMPLIPALTLPYLIVRHGFVWTPMILAACIVSGLIALGMIATLASSLGIRMLRFVTLVPVVLAVAPILRVGGSTIDERLTARPLANDIFRVEAGNLDTAVYRVSRETEYGLAFYRNQVIHSYDRGDIPAQPHLLVTAEGDLSKLTGVLGNRRVSLLGAYPPQKLEYYWVSAPNTSAHPGEHMH